MLISSTRASAARAWKLGSACACAIAGSREVFKGSISQIARYRQRVLVAVTQAQQPTRIAIFFLGSGVRSNIGWEPSIAGNRCGQEAGGSVTRVSRRGLWGRSSPCILSQPRENSTCRNS